MEGEREGGHGRLPPLWDLGREEKAPLMPKRIRTAMG